MWAWGYPSVTDLLESTEVTYGYQASGAQAQPLLSYYPNTEKVTMIVKVTIEASLSSGDQVIHP